MKKLLLILPFLLLGCAQSSSSNQTFPPPFEKVISTKYALGDFQTLMEVKQTAPDQTDVGCTVAMTYYEGPHFEKMKVVELGKGDSITCNGVLLTQNKNSFNYGAIVSKVNSNLYSIVFHRGSEDIEIPVYLPDTYPSAYGVLPLGAIDSHSKMTVQWAQQLTAGDISHGANKYVGVILTDAINNKFTMQMGYYRFENQAISMDLSPSSFSGGVWAPFTSLFFSVVTSGRLPAPLNGIFSASTTTPEVKVNIKK